MIKHFVPKDLADALDILQHNDCYIMAGGTDLMVQKHVSSGLAPAFDRSVLYVMGLKELDYIKEDKEGKIHIGATTKYSELLASPLIPEVYKTVINEVASPNIRNMATLVGNIGNASPAGDAIVPLVLNDAYVVLSSSSGSREVLVKDYIVGVRKTIRKSEEMITEIVIKPLNLQYFYRKVGARKAESISKISFLGAYKIEQNIIKDFRACFGSVAIKASRDLEIENKYKNIPVEKLDIDSVIKDYSSLISPITDHRSNEFYRRKVSLNLLRKFLTQMKGESRE